MPFSHGSKGRLLVQGYDWSGYLRSISTPEEKPLVDVTVLTSTGKSYLTGLRDATVTLEGFFDGTTTPTPAIDKQLSDALALTAPTAWCHMPYGDAFGNRFNGFNCWTGTYEITTPADGAVAFTAEGRSTLGRQGGRIISPMSSKATGNGTNDDNGVGPTYPTTGCAGYLHVSAAAGTTLAVTIQDSADGSSGWASIVTFTSVAAASVPTGEVINLPTQSVRRYVRANYTCTGGNFTFWVGFCRYP